MGSMECEHKPKDLTFDGVNGYSCVCGAKLARKWVDTSERDVDPRAGYYQMKVVKEAS